MWLEYIQYHHIGEVRINKILNLYMIALIFRSGIWYFMIKHISPNFNNTKKYLTLDITYLNNERIYLGRDIIFNNI
jgi:hypothetical protein